MGLAFLGSWEGVTKIYLKFWASQNLYQKERIKFPLWSSLLGSFWPYFPLHKITALLKKRKKTVRISLITNVCLFRTQNFIAEEDASVSLIQ